MIRLLTFTNLYPSDERPRHGIFVEERLRRLVATGRVTASVVVPVAGARRNRMAERYGLPVTYVGFPAIRAVTSWVNPLLLVHCAREAVAEHIGRLGEFDVLDAHYFYPDGVAGVRLARRFGKPAVVTARGSDINVAAREPVAGAWIRWAARRCAAMVAVSEALRDAMVARGLPPGKITVLRNGVDLERFRPLDRDAARAPLGLSGPVLLAVGNLVPEKGHDLAIRALARLPAARLVIIGAGPQQANLEQLAAALGVTDRVRWVAPVPQDLLVRYYSAADLCLLSSSREGMPNVLLESLACGTPVVASAVGGVPEIVTAPAAGSVVAQRTPEALAAACAGLLRAPPERAAVRRHAERFGWEDPVRQQVSLLESVAAAGRA
ncbi:MAG TPA: glycosyltransferase [Steroidobacteraceae bacterium]|jgi:glycosyltransferase involved in cell wall biosynthesis